MRVSRDDVGITVFSELYEVGPTLDGGPIIGSESFVVAWLRGGRRFRHDRTFVSHINTGEFDDDGYPIYMLTHDQAQRAVNRLVERIQSSYDEQGFITLDDAHWSEMDPEYGSQAYITQGIEFERALNERQAG